MNIVKFDERIIGVFRLVVNMNKTNPVKIMQEYDKAKIIAP